MTGIAIAATLAPYQRRIELLSATALAGIVGYRVVRLVGDRPGDGGPGGDR